MGVVRKATPLLDELIQRIQVATAAYGAKRRLAQFIGVPPQRINEWLNGTTVPGGETALALLKWVEAAEAQQKTDPGGALTPPGQMAQQRKSSSNEKPKPGRRKASGKNPP